MDFNNEMTRISWKAKISSQKKGGNKVKKYIVIAARNPK